MLCQRMTSMCVGGTAPTTDPNSPDISILRALLCTTQLIHPRLWGSRRFPVWKLGAAALFEDSCSVGPMLAPAAGIACLPADGYAGIADPEPTQKRGAVS